MKWDALLRSVAAVAVALTFLGWLMFGEQRLATLWPVLAAILMLAAPEAVDSAPFLPWNK